MKSSLALLVVWLTSTAATLGQGVSVELILDQKYFLPSESLPVKVRITNYSGQTLNLGKDEDWLTFNLEGRKDYGVSKLSPVPVAGEYTLDSSRTGTKTVDLAPHYDLSRPGHYTLTTSVKIPQWDRVIHSAPRSFDIVTGNKLWEQEFGMPQIEGATTERPEIRRYALVQTIHQKQLTLYFRLSDATETRVFRIFPVGQMVSFSKPEPQLDKFSNLHILYQINARSFIYSVINPDGLLIARETHVHSDTRPKLRADADGTIKVAGGVRRFTSSDLPPALTSTSSSDGAPPQP